MEWFITYASRKSLPATIEADGYDDVCNKLQAFADASMASKHPIGKLEFEVYTDEVHAFYRSKISGRRVRFANVQA